MGRGPSPAHRCHRTTLAVEQPLPWSNGCSRVTNVSVTPASELVLDALGDPMRRRILEALRGGEMPVGELAARLPILRPAVSKHLRVLADAGLVRHRAEGTRHLYAVDAVGVHVARAWLEQFWDEALASFAAYAGAVPSEEES